MQTINPAVKIIREAIGKQKVAGDADVRPLHYVVKDRVNGGTLWYNVLTREMLLIDDDEQGLAETMQRLKEQWFVVPQGFDDAKFCREVRQLNAILGINKGDKSITGYTIFTTTDCNARCYYCFELGRPRRPMTQKVAEDTAHYIIDHANGNEVKLSWFGGEPLYNMSAIETITGILRDNGQKFTSLVVSNGYLFTEEVVHKAKTEWNLKSVQISLDGTQDIYNRSKGFIYKGVNAYARVLDNIGNLLAEEIKVSIRLNVSSKNGKDLYNLVKELHEHYGKQKFLTVYSHALFDGSEYKREYGYEVKRRIHEDRMAIEGLASEYGYKGQKYLDKDLSLYYCMADNPYTVTIQTDGRIGKCEHYSDDHYFGSIYGGAVDNDVVKMFQRKEQLPTSCNGCAYYPDCVRIEACPDKEPCIPEDKEEHIDEVHRKMLNTYNAWKEWKKKERGSL